MKKSLIENVRSIATLNKAWSAIRKNARISKLLETRDEAIAFEEKATENITRIQRQLNGGKFIFKPAKGKRIPKKKKGDFRPLVVAPLESRIVQRAVHDVLVQIPALHPYIKTPYSFGGMKKGKEDELASVPAAIKCALDAIGSGSVFVVRSDISDFFTCIPKSQVTETISKLVNEPNFIKLFSEAIDVELENMAQLKHHAIRFPIEDIGVAQGNSLSPRLGNIFLADFDRELNLSQDVKCIRYIDDILVLAPSRSIANNHFSKAKAALKKKGLTLSDSKTVIADAKTGFIFLGIEIVNGLIRPSKEKRDDLVDSVSNLLEESRKSFATLKDFEAFDSKFNLLNTLLRTRALIQGWGKHYWFCNDFNCIEVMDKEIDHLIERYRSDYASFRSRLDVSQKRTLLGIEGLGQMDRSRHFSWPSINNGSVKAL